MTKKHNDRVKELLQDIKSIEHALSNGDAVAGYFLVVNFVDPKYESLIAQDAVNVHGWQQLHSMLEIMTLDLKNKLLTATLYMNKLLSMEEPEESASMDNKKLKSKKVVH